MPERLIHIEVDEAFSEKSGKSYLRINIIVDGKVVGEISTLRGTSPEYLSQVLNETGCFIKYENVVDLPEKEREEIGDIYIEASYIVPGLKE